MGLVLMALGMLMIGGSDVFDFQKQPVFIFLGLCLAGLAAGIMSIPVVPEMIEAIREDEKINEKYDSEMIENSISGLYISVTCLGESIGPVFSGFMID